ncbi:MAG: polysaccharide deacetylase family protein [Clostridia bacterium]|nr:polysaccharide deacetylase family protein [Clostridia bacterium]
MKKTIIKCFLLLLVALTLMLQISANCGELHWYCTRQKAHRQAIAASELRFVEEYGSYYIDHTHNEASDEKVIYLTFDAGYENGNVEKILNTLQETQTPAAFFVLKHLVTANTALVQRMVSDGHLVCNHTAHHPNLAMASADQIAKELRELETVCQENGIVTAPYFRPPEGSFSKEMLQHVQKLGYKTIFWSFAYADWDNAKQPSQDHAIRCIMDNVHNGAVLLLHPTSATNAAVLPTVIKSLKEEGYRFGTLKELCGD